MLASASCGSGAEGPKSSAGSSLRLLVTTSEGKLFVFGPGQRELGTGTAVSIVCLPQEVQLAF